MVRQHAIMIKIQATRVILPTTMPAIYIADGTLEAVKWLAAGLMLVDHVNKYIFASKYEWAFNAGRVAFPLFMIAFGYNLARPIPNKTIVLARTIKRLLMFGLISMPPFVTVGGAWLYGWPLNVLFSMLTVATIIKCWEESNERLAILVFFIAGFFVEYFHPGVILGVGTWAYTKKPSKSAAFIALFGLSTMAYINHSHWALASLFILFAATKIEIKLNRRKWLFYTFYPAHLYMLCVLHYFL